MAKPAPRPVSREVRHQTHKDGVYTHSKGSMMNHAKSAQIFTQDELINRLTTLAGLTESEALKVLEAMASSMSKAIKEGGTIYVKGFGKIFSSIRPSLPYAWFPMEKGKGIGKRTFKKGTHEIRMSTPRRVIHYSPSSDMLRLVNAFYLGKDPLNGSTLPYSTYVRRKLRDTELPYNDRPKPPSFSKFCEV